MNNIIVDIDSYKVGMFRQYPEGTEYVSSYIEARGSKDKDYTDTVFFGMQYFLKEYLEKPITDEMVTEAKEVFALHGEPFNEEGWRAIVAIYGGYLPLEIQAVPEGLVVPTGNVLVQVVNTDPEFFWLTTWVETAMLRTIWYATSVASNSRTVKKLMKDFYIKSGSTDGLDFKLHDFGSRGVSSKESAGIGGLAHLINFQGTDTIEALMYGRNYYNIEMPGFSIPAMEHSTVTTWGSENEEEAFTNMMDNNKEFPMVAMVADSYDIYNTAETIFGKNLKSKILEGNQVVVVRPDSGDPTEVPITVIELLMDNFGYSMNEEGYRTLPNNIRVIQGDGITKDSIKDILAELDEHKLTMDNLAFGMGSGLLQQVNRDTYGFAMKASNITIKGKDFDVYKDPLHSGKKSKRGILGLYHNENTGFTTERVHDIEANILRTVYDNGDILVDDQFENIRNRARI
ncbi:MAG: nicotinate phosphoribosyltransferase [Desulfobacteraceae bacterium]|nr:nicotinate phosphoribosyltransferase [Desulfobacteraceae bacterium]